MYKVPHSRSGVGQLMKRINDHIFLLVSFQACAGSGLSHREMITGSIPKPLTGRCLVV